LLLPGGENELRATVDALEHPIGEFGHWFLAPTHPRLSAITSRPSGRGIRTPGKVSRKTSKTERDLLLFAAVLLAIAFTRKRLFDTPFLTRLQVVRVPLDLFDDVFLLHFPLEPAQSVLEGFTLLKPDLSHSGNTPLLAFTSPHENLRYFEI
jgi:hypothetical protein